MLTTLLPWLVAPVLLGADNSLPAGSHLSYRGSVAQLGENRTPGEAQKTFDLTLLVGQTSDAGTTVYWTIEERGRGAWPWTERFGSLLANKAWQNSGSQGPALLYDLGESTSPIDLPLPMLAGSEPLAAGLEWTQDPWTYSVQRSARFEGREAWQVQVSNNYGPKRTLWIDKQSPLAVGVNERVFMDMGQEYQLQLRLVGNDRLEADKLRPAIDGFESLLALRAKLNVPDGKETLELNPKQLALLSEQLPALEQAIRDEALSKVVRSARRDLSLQSDRTSAVDKLAKEYRGRGVEPFTTDGLNRERLTQDDLRGHVTVLHFWDYRDAPLKEPYGQIGYLDFLSHRRKPDGVRVYGVAVDGRLADEATHGQAVRGIRKLKSFMNLSYPIFLDGGSLIKQFGDPRLVGAELPLFVVVGRDGKIAHYRVGHYEVDRNEGLKELNAAVSEALAK